MRRILPARAVIALGVAGLTAIGATTVGTSAAFTDNAAATSTIKSVPNFFPTPLTTDLDCYSKGSAGFRQVEFWWPTKGNTPLGVPYTYQLIVKDQNGGIVRNEHITTGPDGNGWHTRSQFRHSATAKTYRVEIHTVNGSVMSTGAMVHNIYIATTSDTYCTGSNYLQANPPFENDIYGGMGPASARIDTANLSAPSPNRDTSGDTPPTTTAAQSTTEATPSTTTAPSTAAPSTTSGTSTTAPSSTTTTAPKTTTSTAQPGTTEPTSTQSTTTSAEDEASPTTTTATTTPTAALVGAKPSPSGTYTAGRSGSDAVVRDASGQAVFTGAVPTTAVLQWDTTSDRLWIVDGYRVRYVEAGSWTSVSVAPDSGQVPDAVAALIK